jgi:hypothetical protein
MRDEDEGCETLHDNPHNACIQKSFNARCTESNKATNASDGVDYAVGTMVWTLVGCRASHHRAHTHLPCLATLVAAPTPMLSRLVALTLRRPPPRLPHLSSSSPLATTTHSLPCLSATHSLLLASPPPILSFLPLRHQFDYYGEPPVGGLEVSSTYGQFDLVGFPKAAALWYRMQWLLGIPDSRSDKTYKTGSSHEVWLVESWESPDAFPSTKGNKSRSSIHAYSSAPYVELFVNGQSRGVRSVTTMLKGAGSYAEWLDVAWEAGNLTAVARSSPAGAAVASTSRFTNGAAARIQLSIDAPSAATGTGSGLVLDGQDAALLRASVVDANGRVMHLATSPITFTVVSGPGRIQGSHNGDPHNHVASSNPTNTAYHGLVRAVVRVTSVSARTAEERALLRRVDVHGPMAADAPLEALDSSDIVVQATSPGFAPATISIPTSGVDVMATATAAAGKPVDFFSSYS